MTDNETFSGDGKKGEEELLDFDFDVSSGNDTEGEGGDFPSDEEILELVDIVEPAADIGDSESDEIAKLLEEEPVEGTEEKVVNLDIEGESDRPPEEDTSQILESDIGSVLDDLDLAEGGTEEKEPLFDGSESDEIAKLLGEEPEEGPEEKELGLEMGGESDVGSVFDDTTQLEGGTEEKEALFDDSESDEIAKLLEQEPEEEAEDLVEEEELEELEEISEEDTTQVFEADMDTTLADLEPAGEIDTALDLQEGDLESIYEDESLSVSRVEPEESAEAEAKEEAPSAGAELGEETTPEIPYEDLSEVSEPMEEPLEEELYTPEEQEIRGISQERIESIVREVVEEVVERVARETMTSVAERVITGAIDALRESIESSRD